MEKMIGFDTETGYTKLDCHYCKSPAYVVIGGINYCPTCGTEIRLCEKHYAEFKKQIEDLGEKEK